MDSSLMMSFKSYFGITIESSPLTPLLSWLIQRHAPAYAHSNKKLIKLF